MAKKYNRTKFVATFALFFLLAMALAFSVSAANSLESIDVSVVLYKDGSAEITQKWKGSFFEGTECYIPFSDNGYLSIDNLKVGMDGKEYETLSLWSTDWSFDEKAYKCGLLKVSGGYEICFGISEYGEHTYTLSYTVPLLVGSYRDSDGFNFRFINDKMNPAPARASVSIELWNGTEITDEICNIWGFGYNGSINFRNGKIFAATYEAPLKSSHMTIMCQFPKGIFDPTRIVTQSFEEVKENAFEGSNYEKGDGNDIFFTILIISAFVLGIVALVGVIVYEIAGKVKLKRFIKEVPYFRDIPNKGDIDMTYVLGSSFKTCTESSIVGARLLGLIKNGIIIPCQEEDTGFFGNTKKVTSLRLQKDNLNSKNLGEADTLLCELLEKASGEDGILQEKELEKYCKKSPLTLRRFIDLCKEKGDTGVALSHCYSTSSHNRISSLTSEGKEELSQIFGLKKYLLDFSLISERGLGEFELWQDYMTYATLFGIADKVAKQLKSVYPEYVPQIETFEQYTIYAYSYSHIMYGSMLRREQEIQAQRSAGSGGFSSFGGGGGFSGGGSGGGTR